MSNVIEDGLRTLSVRQLAVAMGIPTWRIYEMIRNAEAPPHFRIGKTHRFRLKSVDAWLDEQTNNQKESAPP